MTTIKFDAKKLADVLTIANKMQQETLEVSKQIFFEFSNNVAKIYATNATVEVNTKIECIMDGDNRKIAVDKKDMLNIINEIKKDSNYIILEIENNEMIIKSDSNTISSTWYCKLRIENYERAPSFIPDNISLHQSSIKDFTEAIKYIIYAAPKKNNYNQAPNIVYILNGKIFYCCDTFRLARYEVTETYPFPAETQISVEAANFIINTVGVLKEDVGRVGVKDRIMVIELGDYRIGARCEEYLFPNYESILAKEWENTIYVRTKDLNGALKQIKKIKEAEYIYIEINPNKPNSLKLSSCNRFGDTKMTIEIDAIIDKLEKSKKTINIQYLIDALKPIKDEYIKLCYPSNSDQWIDIFIGNERYREMIMEAVLS